MNPNELRKKKAEALASAAKINAKLEDPDFNLTDERRAELEAEADGLIEQAEQHENDAKAIEAKEAAARDRAARIGKLQGEAKKATGKVTPEQPAATIEVGEPQWKKDPMKGFSTPREYFGLVTRASNGERVALEDERIQYLATAGTDEMQGGSDPYGGFLLPEAMAPGIQSIDIEADPFVGRTTPLSMNALTVKVNALVDKDHSSSVSGGFTVSRSVETASKTASRTQLEQVKFEANSEFGFSYATEELLRDSPGTVASLLSVGFSREFQSNHVQELLSGTGVGEREGVQNNPALITIAKENGQSAATIVYNNILKMTARCYNYGSAIWLYNHTCYPQLKTLSLPIGTAGVPLWETASTSINGDVKSVSLINGRPAYACEYLSAVGTLYDIMLVVPSAIYEGTYQPLESAESMHVRFDRHERAFKFWQRNDARSLWRSALTPNKGSTLSPFVTLAARA